MKQHNYKNKIKRELLPIIALAGGILMFSAGRGIHRGFRWLHQEQKKQKEKAEQMYRERIGFVTLQEISYQDINGVKEAENSATNWNMPFPSREDEFGGNEKEAHGGLIYWNGGWNSPAAVTNDLLKTNSIKQNLTINAYSQKEVDLLARLIYGEGRGTNKSKVAMAYSALERQIDSRWSDKLDKVILQPKQYSCFNPEDPNYEKVWNPEKDEPESWRKSKETAEKILTGRLENPVPGANHYHSRGSANRPNWTKKGKLLATIEGVEFYRL